MSFLRNIFKKKDNSDWKVINISSSDSPFYIDPKKITHSILILDDIKDCKPDSLYKALDKLQRDLNMEMVESLQKQNLASKIKSTFILSTDLIQGIIPTVEKLGLSKTHSVFVRAPIVSLDGGKTQQTVLVLFLFADSNKHIVISDIPCLPNKLSNASNFFDAFEFSYFTNLEEMTKHILSEFVNSNANKILYVGGLPFRRPYEDEKSLYEKLSRKYNIKYKLYINDNCSLKYLCQAAREIRNSKENSILISNFPRDWDPPKYNYYDSKGNPVIASSPIGTSLMLCEADSPEDNLSVYFEGIMAESYYSSVLASQGCPPRKPLTCKIISWSEDNSLLFQERNQLASSNSFKQRDILINAIEKIEKDAQNNMAIRDYPCYKGGILLQ